MCVTKLITKTNYNPIRTIFDFYTDEVADKSQFIII